MLLSLYESQTFLVKILFEFKDYLKKHSLKVKIINSYNPLYLNDLEINGSYLLVIRPEGFDSLDVRNFRSGSFYENVNEFGFKFILFFLGFVGEVGELKIYVGLHTIYEYFLEFLHENAFEFKFLKQNPLEKEYDLFLNYYLKSTSDLINGGFVKTSCNGLKGVLGLSQNYRANIQIVENKID
ncbi:DUF764 family protein [Borrelia crocidurae]|uniref:Uncharacterized protein n=2 Tax=Borrelia crocidurae TaxID=29520 RepID=I0FE94_BORCA|nr:DUF764 family protein [Borrelia crocidurae]AFI31800.1 Borrelia burgdorferi protein of unknown function (DUF764)-containing protein [Borrelia crocidurae str. Achema]AHH07369.1 Putative cytosolic protein [Borrelia crocidurae DOU]